MEKVLNCGINICIHCIDYISGANREFEVLFEEWDDRYIGYEHRDKRTRYKMILKNVLDMRYSIENASIVRFSKMTRAHTEKSSIFLIEDSEYIKYFTHQVSFTYPTDKLKHYIIVDRTDTTLDVLTETIPVIEKIWDC